MGHQNKRAAKWVAFAASGLGSGYAPWAPGTVTSALTALWLLLFPPANQLLHGLLGILIAGLGVPLAAEAERRSGRKDPGFITIDEVSGQWFALSFVALTPLNVLLGFLLFRLFDIWKPGWVGRAGHLPGGWGVMADDWLAGWLANGILLLVVHFL
jgi:phosphatidylglycerophosphatase A